MDQQIITLFELSSYSDLRTALKERINELIHRDMNLLISILYRLDINEKILKQKLAEADDAAMVIADMIIERQNQKRDSRSAFQSDASDIPEDEKW